VSITQVPTITLGDVGDRSLHQTIVRQALETATEPHPPRSIVPLDHRWPDDLRARQLRKQAH
jgi:hypothetical protein